VPEPAEIAHPRSLWPMTFPLAFGLALLTDPQRPGLPDYFAGTGGIRSIIIFIIICIICMRFSII
jgi:hypothetical protein